MFRVVLILACARPGPPVAAGPASIDPAARSFALRAWRAEALGDDLEAERAWRWVDRLDGGVHARLHHADALGRLGLDATALYREALALDPLDERAHLGLALALGSPLGGLLAAHACTIASSDHPERAQAEALCAR